MVTASGRVREMKDAEHLKGFGIEVGEVKYDREKVAAHAAQVNLLYSYKSTNAALQVRPREVRGARSSGNLALLAQRYVLY